MQMWVQKYCLQIQTPIRYFRYVFCLRVQTSLRLKFHINQSRFHIKGHVRGLVLKQKHKATCKRPIGTFFLFPKLESSSFKPGATHFLKLKIAPPTSLPALLEWKPEIFSWALQVARELSVQIIQLIFECFSYQGRKDQILPTQVTTMKKFASWRKKFSSWKVRLPFWKQQWQTWRKDFWFWSRNQVRKTASNFGC